MVSFETLITLLSSLTLRVCAYVFLRWIPGPWFPTIIFTSALIYCISFINKLQNTSAYRVIAEEIDVVTHPLSPAEARAEGLPANAQVEEVEVQDTVILEEKPAHALRTILTGLPSPSSLLWSGATFLTNLALVGMVADMTFRSALLWPAHDLSFARLGYVSESSARLLVREPDVGQLPIFLSYRHADVTTARKAFDSAWKHADTIKWLSEDTDFTAVLEIDGLSPDTRYQYAFSNNHSGYFVTAPSIGQVSARAENNEKFTFLHSSCILPRMPYAPFQHPLEIAGFRTLSNWLGVLKPAFMLFLGDFIYVDVPRRHGKDRETYRREYRQIYASPDWPAVSSTKYSPSGSDTPYDIPWLHIYDDHEIANDWAANTTTVYPAAFDAYLHYQLAPNPPLFLSASATPQGLVEDATLPSWSIFDQGPGSFFIMDTRRYRVPSNPLNASDPTVSMLGMAQLFSLLTWLARPPPPGVHWKFVISSVPFTKNWRDAPGTSDTWSGYVHERNLILQHMWKASFEQSVGIVVLSGDRHEFAATAFPPSEESGWPAHAMVHEFSCSPLNMFHLPVRTYVQDDPEDVMLKYIPDGNAKFGAVTISKETKSGQSLLTYRLFVDGEETWSHFLTAGDSSSSSLSPRYRSSRGSQPHLHNQHNSHLQPHHRLEQLRDGFREGWDQIASEGTRLVRDGEELIGRREDAAAEHIGEARHRMQDVAGLVGRQAREGLGSITEPWVGRSGRFQPGWGERDAQ